MRCYLARRTTIHLARRHLARQSGRLREPRWRREPAPTSTCQLIGLKARARGCSSMCALALTFVTCSASVRPLPAQQSGRLREPRWRREPAPASTCQLLGLKVHAHGCSSMCALALTFVTCSCPPATCPTSCRLNHAVAASPLQPRPAGDQRLMLLIGLSSHCFRCRDTARRAGPNARRAQRRTTLAVNNAAILHPALREAMPCACCTHAQEPCKGPPPLCDTRRAPCAAMRRLPLSHPIILRLHVFLRSATTDFSWRGNIRVHVRIHTCVDYTYTYVYT